MSKMAAAFSPSFNARPKRRSPPPSELPSTVAHRRTKTRDVASRYLDTTTTSSSLFQPSPSKRCHSPTVTRTTRLATPSSVTKRPQSTAGRRQSVTPSRGGGEVSAAERMLLTSGRSLFGTFHADSSYTRKLNSSPPISPRRGTLEKKMTTPSRNDVASQEKSKKSFEQWPRSLKPNCLSRSVDFTYTRKKPKGSCNSVENVRSYSMISVHNFGLPLKRVSTTRKELIPKSEQIVSERGTSIARGRIPSRGVVHPRGISPSGRMMSPLRVRSSLSSDMPLSLNFAVDGKNEKFRENGVADDAHLLRLLHNRLLQWRFANARANSAVSAQKMRADKRLYNASRSIAKLYDSVRAKGIGMQRLKLNLKLVSILNRQMGNLEEWLVVERDYMSSLVGAADALKGSTLCLPVDCAATVNVQSVKDAIGSAVDVMQAMASSICLLLPKVGKISCLAAELGRVNVKEQEKLDVCKDLLNTISALQVTECSFKTQAIQLQ